MSVHPADLVLEARDELTRPDGWLAGNLGAYCQPDGAVCAVGALRRSVFRRIGFLSDADNAWYSFLINRTHPELLRAYNEAEAALDNAAPDGSIVTFNDHYARTPDDLVTIFDVAATRLKEDL